MTSPARRNTADQDRKTDRDQLAPDDPTVSPHSDREQASRLADGLELLRAERLVSEEEHEANLRKSKSRHRPIPEDAFNEKVEQTQQTTQEPPTAANKLWTKIKKFPRVIRYFVYMTPVAAILLAPILIDLYAVPNQKVPVGGPGGVALLWFGVWLEIVWGTLWASRIICAIIPYFLKWCAKAVGSSNHKKWKDIGSDLELHVALFLWMLAVLCSFLPTVNNHRDDTVPWNGDSPPYIRWIDVVNKVIISLFVLATLNIVEQILIQWIASSFHVRTYAYRIEANKGDIKYLVQLYEYSRQKTQDETLWGPRAATLSSGTKTPLKTIQANARQAWARFGLVANRMAGDFTGRKILNNNHPRKVVLELLRTTPTSHTLARMLFRALRSSPDRENLVLDDFQPAFSSAEEAEACFGVFDRDLNGDISMEEMEHMCNEIHLEKKAIAASLKDLDSVVKKLDKVFLFIIIVISIIVFISIISGSAAAALGSAGTTILGLAWMLQATAQEFLQSIIFVFVKHPFDVGDRVRVYGSTGAMMQGDDYYVQEISLLYTEFKKMEGHVVQAPNSLLNTLFILNQRRSNGLADPIELKVRFGIRNEVIEELKARMLDFVMENKRDYAPRIVTEMRTIDEVWSVTINFIFFHKSNYQNELLRLQRHNKFTSELMRQMLDLGIEGPRKHQPGGEPNFPFYATHVALPPVDDPATTGGAPPTNPNAPRGTPDLDQSHDQQPLQPFPSSAATATATSIAPLASASVRRRRAESRVTRFDAVPDFQDVYEGRRGEGGITASSLTRLQSIRAGDGGSTFSRSSLERTQSRPSGSGVQRHPSNMLSVVEQQQGGQQEQQGQGQGHRFSRRSRNGNNNSNGRGHVTGDHAGDEAV